MTILSLDFDTLAAADPATPPTGYAKPAGSDNAKIFGAAPKVFGLSSGTNTIWYSTTAMTGSVVEARITLPAVVSTDSCGVALLDTSFNGLMVLTGVTAGNFRIFAVLNGQLTGAALFTSATIPSGSAVIRFRRTITAGNDDYEVFQNDVKLGATYTNNNYDVVYGGAVSRFGAVKSMAIEYTAAQSVDTLTNPLVLGSAFSGTSTGFTSGAATLSTGSQSAATTLATGAFSGTMPTLTDGSAWPLLPATSVTATLTQGAVTANILVGLSLPTGWGVTRDLTNNPANFLAIIDLDSTYLAWPFKEAANPLTTSDRVYWDASTGLTISLDSSISLPVANRPLTTNIFVHRADGNVYIHEITINEAGILASARAISTRSLTLSALTMPSLTLRT